MKSFKKALAAFIAAVMAMGIMAVHAFAETLNNDNGSIRYSVPSGWEFIEDHSTFNDGLDLKAYRCGNDDGYGWI